MTKPTQARLKELFDYSPDSGKFVWRTKRKKCRVGSEAGTVVSKLGFIKIGVDLGHHLAHHLAWVYMTGEWPAGCITHINRDGFDNRWENLRITKRQRVEKCDLTQTALMGELTYDEQSGTFMRCRDGTAAQGRITGTLGDEGYVLIPVLGRVHRAHRLAWLYVHGVMPDGEIDHINRDRADNRIANLRLASSSQNKQNTPLRSDNTSGFRGVSKKRGKWTARIWVDKKIKRLGVFESISDAAAAYERAAASFHSHKPSP